MSLHYALSRTSSATHATKPFGILQVLVQDAHKRPVKDIEIGIEGSGGSRISGDDGKALLPLSKDTVENDWVSLELLHSPSGKDFVIVSPYDNRTPVPSFKNKPEAIYLGLSAEALSQRANQVASNATDLYTATVALNRTAE